MARTIRLVARNAEAQDDPALRERFVRGDRAAFDALVSPHLDALYTLCVRLTRNPSEAEDLAQETLVRVLQQADRYDPERPFRPWLLKVGLNLCRDRIRTVWWRRVWSLDRAAEGEAPLVDGSDPEAGSEAAEVDRRIRTALATLPPKYREAVSLFHLDDMTYAEMADITDVNVPALKQRVRRGCVMLRETVEEMYPELNPTRSRG